MGLMQQHEDWTEDVVDIKSVEGETLREFISPGVPPGLDTVWSYLAREEPHIVSTIMEDPVFGLMVDQKRACVLAQQLGLALFVREVEAPPALKEAGVEFVNAFPREVMRALYPVSP